MCILSPLNVVWSGAVGLYRGVAFLFSHCRPSICGYGGGGYVGWGGCVGVGIASSYLNSASPSPFSHCGICTLILCAGTREPLMHRWVARTNVMATLLVTYPHVFE